MKVIYLTGYCSSCAEEPWLRESVIMPLHAHEKVKDCQHYPLLNKAMQLPKTRKTVFLNRVILPCRKLRRRLEYSLLTFVASGLSWEGYKIEDEVYDVFYVSSVRWTCSKMMTIVEPRGKGVSGGGGGDARARKRLSLSCLHRRSSQEQLHFERIRPFKV